MVDTPSIPPSSLPPKSGPVVLSGMGGVGQQQANGQWNLPQGAVIRGQVTQVDANGIIRLETNSVTMVLQTNLQMARNAQITVKLEQPFTGDAMPNVRILTVDGKSVLANQIQQQAQQGAQQQPAATPQTTAPVQSAERAAELAKPIGVLLEITAKPSAAAKMAEPAAQMQVQAQAARNIAAQINLTPAQTLPAVLIRPLMTAKAAEILASLPAGTLTAPGRSLPATSTPVAQMPLQSDMLKPGLQLQVRITQNLAPLTPPAQAAAASPETTTAALVTSKDTTPVSPIARAAYAVYARQPAAPMAAATPGLPPSSPTPATPSASIPVETSLSTASPQAATASSSTAALPPPVSGAPPEVSADSASPYIPGQPLSPKVVGQLLGQVESKGLSKGEMAAVVIGKEPAGNLMVQTRLGLFTLPASQGEVTQPGTVMTWAVKQMQVMPLALQGLEGEMAGPTGLLANAAAFGREGSAIYDLVSLLATMPTATASQALQRVIPHAGNNLSAGMLLFMSVVRKGDVGNWLGKELIDQLDVMGKGDLVQRLGNEISSLRNLFGSDQPQQTNWQALFFPVMVDKRMETAQLFVKPDESGKKNGGGGTRFVVEVNLTQLGPMQMDGLVKKRESRTYFDLVIRTLSELPPEIKSGIIGIFDTAQQSTGLVGSLSFRTVPEFTVNPLEEMDFISGNDAGSFFA